MYTTKVIASLICLGLIFTGCSKPTESVETNSNETYEIVIVDDSGTEIKLKEPAQRIISLYSAHTENLFEIEAGDQIIGRGKSDVYPVKVLDKTIYDYRSDPEKVIAAEPDLVIIRPFIERKSPDFVKAIKQVGIPVVSLYPEHFDDFDDYIMTLALLTGKEDVAKSKLNTFHKEIEILEQKTKELDTNVGVYFESTQTEYRTVTLNSMPGKAIQIAGGYSVAGDLEPIKEGSSIAAFGIESILEKAEEIDVYISQRGVMNAGGNYHTIVIRPGFKAIKAVEEKNVFEINQKIISSPTFRYVKGIHEMARMFHPDVFDNYDIFDVDEPITKRDYAELMVKYNHRSIFVPTSKYYDKKYPQHTYAFFKDVKVNHPQFDFIETAVLGGYVDGEKVDGIEWFHPDKEVTRDDLAKTAIILSEFKPIESTHNIIDIEESENKRVVQMIVDNNILPLKDGKFNPKKTVTGKEVIDMLKRIDAYKEEKGL